MKIKFMLDNINWECQFKRKNISGISFTMYDNSKDLPSECELVVDDPKRTAESFPKVEFSPGRYTYMDNKTISYVFKQLKAQFGEKPSSVYINGIEDMQ